MNTNLAWLEDVDIDPNWDQLTIIDMAITFSAPIRRKR